MLGQSIQALDILFDELWSSVMVIQNGKYPIDNGVICLSDSNINGEDCMYYNE